MKNQRILSKYDGKKLGWFRWWRQLLIFIIVAIILAVFVFGVTRINGNSMNPTLENGQIVGIYKIGNDNRKVGDIIAIKMTSGENYVKRIVAVGGDVVDVKDGQLYVNNILVTDDGSVGKTLPEDASVVYPYTVDEGRYFVLGDNREDSIDSRTFGSIYANQIIGKVIKF